MRYTTTVLMPGGSECFMGHALPTIVFEKNDPEFGSLDVVDDSGDIITRFLPGEWVKMTVEVVE